MKPILKILAKIAALGLGLWLLWPVIQRIHWQELMSLFHEAGYVLLVAILIFPIACIFHTLALKPLILNDEKSNVRFKDLYFVRLIGDSINRITPFMDIGGEPLKMAMLAKRRIISLPQAVIMIWMSRVGFVVSEIIVVLVGWWVLHTFYPGYVHTWVIIAGVIISFIHMFLLVQAGKHGLIKIVPHLARTMKISVEAEVWNEADRGLKTFYKKNMKGFVTSTAWQVLGWVTATIEIYIIFKVLGYDIDWVQAFIFQSIIQVIKTASFFIPSNIGALEGGLASLAVHMGFTATSGIALSLVKRFRQLIWIMVGFVIWKFSKPSKV